MLGKDSLLVDVAAAGVNYMDLVTRTGNLPGFATVPFRLGLEVAGVVREVGSGVTAWKPGDTVAALTLGGGGYASHVVVPASHAIRIPGGLAPTLAAAILVQGLTAFLTLEAGAVTTDKKVQVEFDQTKRTYLPSVPGSLEADLGAGLFTKKAGK